MGMVYDAVEMVAEGGEHEPFRRGCSSNEYRSREQTGKTQYWIGICQLGEGLSRSLLVDLVKRLHCPGNGLQLLLDLGTDEEAGHGNYC